MSEEIGSGHITHLLLQWRDGDEQAFEKLLPLVYDHLRQLASRQIRGERLDHTLQPTALVHEAYVRLQGDDKPRWNDRAHFFAIASLVMRRVLVDHARALQAQRRGAGAVAVELEDDMLTSEKTPDVLALDEALETLERKDPRKARLVQLRFFGGLTLDEVTRVLKVSRPTVVRDWRLARAWLLRELSGEGSP